ncbi:MAG: bifunctional phosphoribosyl-AMP cyclohydrolase/phosphoribosyl-ATP diphosphatase HisIE [Firmicutes bacterium]|nr:bifunctional phosphoribosyl-AMP cyclohydrolase/phosphoribosyl-ATP diphosphatase HisIE [Bacillota bacterium]
MRTGQVLMVAYMNEEALRRTLAKGTTWFWSRSRGRLWQKGETSGHRQQVREIRVDCDGDALLVLVEQVGVACHEGTYSCFRRRLPGAPAAAAPAGWFPNAPAESAAIGAVLTELAGVLAERRRHPDPGSYTARLLARWPDGPLKKVAEEAGEVLLAAKAGDRAAVVWEVADLWFHTLVVLTAMGISLDEVAAELARRRGRRRAAGERGDAPETAAGTDPQRREC